MFLGSSVLPQVEQQEVPLEAQQAELDTPVRELLEDLSPPRLHQRVRVAHRTAVPESQVCPISPTPKVSLPRNSPSQELPSQKNPNRLTRRALVVLA